MSYLPSRMPMSSALAAVVLAAAACGSSEPVAAPDATLELGASVYASSCASCHGADLTGTNQGPSHLSSVYNPNHHSDAAFESAIEFGSPQHHWPFGDMPPVEGLDDGEVAAVIAFVRSQQEERGFEG